MMLYAANGIIAIDRVAMTTVHRGNFHPRRFFSEDDELEIKEFRRFTCIRPAQQMRDRNGPAEEHITELQNALSVYGISGLHTILKRSTLSEILRVRTPACG
jgi:hypothetical protein